LRQPAPSWRPRHAAIAIRAEFTGSLKQEALEAKDAVLDKAMTSIQYPLIPSSRT